MKKLYIYIFLFLLCGFRTFSQQKSFVGTSTLFSTLEDPAQSLFTDKNSFFSISLPIPSLWIDNSFRGHAKRVVTDAIYGDQKLTTDELRQGFIKSNHIKTNARIDWLQMKIKLNPKKREEVSLSVSTRVFSSISLRDELIDVGLAGNDFYAGKNVDGLFNTNSYAYAFNEIKFGYRKNLNEKLGFGFQLAFMKGVSYAAFNIDRSNAYFAPRDSGYFVDVSAHGKIEQAGLQQEEIKQSLLDWKGFFRNPALSFGFSYQVNERLYTDINMLDIGSLSWFNGTTYTINKTIRFKGINYNMSKSQQDSIFKTYPKMISDTFKNDNYSVLLPTRIQAAARYKWNNRISSGLLFIGTLSEPGLELHLMNDLKVYRNLHWIVNTGLAANTYYQLGASLLLEAKHLHCFIGSEQVGNLMLSGFSPGLNFQCGASWKFYKYSTFEKMQKVHQGLKSS